ncbi:MAG: Bax inhibitor-1/YccA family protein [Spirochaetota bacterium]|nr:Bax inhibitor-1/YccA family protein [Spirochaetota bacterium]
MAYSRAEFLSIPRVRERNILRNVYLWMTAGLALTGVVSIGVAGNPALMRTLLGNQFLFLALIIGELALVLYLSARINQMTASRATLAFAGYSILNGITLSIIFLVYTGAEISLAFFTAAGTFAGMSLYAMTTKRDLSGIGHYLIMGLWGIILASVINIFLRSEGLYYMISYIGVFVFIGLTAYDTQMIKRWNENFGTSISEEQYVKLSILGALKLYLDFLNMFLFMLRIFGRRN